MNKGQVNKSEQEGCNVGSCCELRKGGHSARRRKCKCVLLLLVCEWLVAQSRPKGKEERTIWAGPQNDTTKPMFGAFARSVVSVREIRCWHQIKGNRGLPSLPIQRMLKINVN